MEVMLEARTRKRLRRDPSLQGPSTDVSDSPCQRCTVVCTTGTDIVKDRIHGYPAVMSPRRLDKLDEERKKRLFESAAEEFAEKGYDGASLNRILKNSGMGKSSLYYYFDDKADLFTTLIERLLGVFLKQIGVIEPESLTAENYWTELEIRYRKALVLIGANRWLVKFGSIFYGLRASPKGSPFTGRVFEAARKWVRRLIAHGQEIGVIRTDLPESLLIDTVMGLLEAIDRWVVMHWDELDSDEREKMPELHIGLFRRFLCEEGSDTP